MSFPDILIPLFLLEMIGNKKKERSVESTTLKACAQEVHFDILQFVTHNSEGFLHVCFFYLAFLCGLGSCLIHFCPSAESGLSLWMTRGLLFLFASNKPGSGVWALKWIPSVHMSSEPFAFPALARCKSWPAAGKKGLACSYLFHIVHKYPACL